MKTVLLLILVAVASGCKKNGQCYNCDFGTVNNYKPPAEEYCGPIPYAKKVNGIDYPTYCTTK